MIRLFTETFGRQGLGRNAVKGVSLVEVALALGILSFGAVPMMALMASGFNGYRSAMDSAVQSAIAQRIRADSARLTTAATSLPASYYTDDGTPTTSADPRALYRVNHATQQGAFQDVASPVPLPRTLVSRYTITHLPSGAVHATGFIHVTPR